MLLMVSKIHADKCRLQSEWCLVALLFLRDWPNGIFLFRIFRQVTKTVKGLLFNWVSLAIYMYFVKCICYYVNACM